MTQLRRIFWFAVFSAALLFTVQARAQTTGGWPPLQRPSIRRGNPGGPCLRGLQAWGCFSLALHPNAARLLR